MEFSFWRIITKIMAHNDFDPLRGICLWNNNYLLVGCSDNTIKLVDLKKGIIIQNIKGNNDYVITIRKIVHPLYGC